MAWIKMRTNLWDDPRVSRLCDLTDQGEATIVGALYWLWAAADQHTEDGCMPGLSMAGIDRKTGVQGFAAAMVEIDWLHKDEQGVVIARFWEHNGQSAKRRASEAQRKANSRAVSASDADAMRTDCGQGAELEKEEEKNSLSSQMKREKARRGSRLPQDWKLPEEWAAWASNERPDLDPLKTAELFRDYWHGKGEARADWLATWRNWVRREKATAATTESRSSTGETAYQRSMRERMQVAAPLVAAKAPGASTNPLEMFDARPAAPRLG